jgi:outer membrane receptor protein involved in Fe transport
MKTFLLVILCCYLSVTALAQTTSQTLTVKGTAIDSLANKPLGYVTVALIDAGTKKPVKGTLTKDDGSFKLEGIKGGKYQVSFASVGYKSKVVSVSGAGTDINIGKVFLSVSNNQLGEISITAVKPLVKQEIDRISYDVQADPETKTQTVLDMLRKVPLVTVDASDNIQLKGNTNYKILINGKPSSLVAHNPSDVFKAMPASSIQKIEIITTPPAKYDAEGLAGIINIITNKKIDQGYNGSINLRENSLWGPGGGISLTLKQGKFGLSMYSGIGDQTKRNSTAGNTLQTFGADPTYLTQSSANVNSGRFIYTSEELSYEIDSLNLITGTIDYNNGKFNSSANQFSQLFDAESALTQSYHLVNNSTSGWHGFDVGLNYQLGFKRNKSQLLTLSYKYSKSPNTSDNTTSFNDRFNYDLPDYQQHNDAGTIEQTFQLDYVHPLKKINIEGGLKAILRNSSSDFGNNDLDTLTQMYVQDPTSTNDFNYHQNVYSLYNTYQLNLDNWGFKAGVRVETTTINADFVSEASNINQDYSNVIPSVSVQRKFKNGTSINFGFTNRIQRPDISQLNPFVNETNPTFITSGNPNLQPVLNHTFELNYSKFSKGSLNLGLTYSFANNTIQNVTHLVDTVTYTTFQNVGSDKNLGFNISVSYPITKNLNLNINSQFSYVFLRGYYNGELYNNKGIQGYTFAYAGYKISDTWRAGVNAGFYSANVLLQGKSNATVFSSLSASKDVLKKKGSIFLNVSNPYTKYRNFNSYTRDPDFYQTATSQTPFRSFGFGFNYRFGKLKSDIKKNQRGINNDDTKGSNKSTTGNQ